MSSLTSTQANVTTETTPPPLLMPYNVDQGQPTPPTYDRKKTRKAMIKEYSIRINKAYNELDKILMRHHRQYRMSLKQFNATYMLEKSLELLQMFEIQLAQNQFNQMQQTFLHEQQHIFPLPIIPTMPTYNTGIPAAAINPPFFHAAMNPLPQQYLFTPFVKPVSATEQTQLAASASAMNPSSSSNTSTSANDEDDDDVIVLEMVGKK